MIVSTKKGKVEGFRKNGINMWFGIPYAKAPLGKLRFRRAVEHEPWSDVRVCKIFGNKPYQFTTGPLTLATPSEDCLYLNIWAPENACKLPVYLWIYGGMYAKGDGSRRDYWGAGMAQSGVIFVNFNYRLGPLGFFDFSMYEKSFETNCGFSDQIAALKWVKENIEAFGGDPDNITIGGESAGATAVYDMLASPAAKGLFKRAIAQSGVPASGGTQAALKLNTDLFLLKMGMSPNDVPKLKTMDPEKMIRAARYVIDEHCNAYPGLFAPGPLIGDDLLPKFPWEAMAEGSAEGIDVIIGTDKDEGKIFVNMKRTTFPNSWGQVSGMLIYNGYADRFSAFTKFYDISDWEWEQMSEFAKDRAFLVDAIRCADAQSDKARVFMYRYDYVPRLLKLLRIGAMHGSEIGLTLNTDGLFAKLMRFTPKHEVSKMKNCMHGCWLSFIKNGNPKGGLCIDWPQYDFETRDTLIFDLNPCVERNPGQKAFELWKDIELYKC